MTGNESEMENGTKENNGNQEIRRKRNLENERQRLAEGTELEPGGLCFGT